MACHITVTPNPFMIAYDKTDRSLTLRLTPARMPASARNHIHLSKEICANPFMPENDSYEKTFKKT